MKRRISTYEYYGRIELICPHCGEKQLNHELDEETAYLCVEICEECGKEIEYSVEVSRVYYPTIPDDGEEKEGKRKNET